jgi:hypothetical protein
MVGHSKGFPKAVIDSVLKRWPKQPRSSNFVVDSQSDAEHEAMLFIVATLMSSPDHVLPLEGTLRKRIRSLEELGDSSGGDVFDKFPSTLGALPENFRSTFICSHTDLTSDLLVNLLKFDVEATSDIIECLLQLPKSFRLPLACKHVAVCNNLLRGRASKVGDRCKFILRDKFIAADGRVMWADCGSYQIIFDKNVAISIKHRPSGDSVKLEGSYIDTGFSLCENFNDWSAYVVKKPMAAQKLHVFFINGALGPYKFPSWKATKCRELDIAVAVATQAFEISRKASSAPASSQLTTDILMELKSDKKKQSLAKAREAAVSTLKAKQVKRVVKLG